MKVYLSVRINQSSKVKVENITKNWYNLEQMKRLGYISLVYLIENKYQFDNEEIRNLQPNINIDVFTEIGLIISTTEGPIVNRTTKYQFAHRTLQEYFAAMFIVKWENELRRKSEEIEELWNNDDWKKDDFQKECKQLIIEILLTKRENETNRIGRKIFNKCIIYSF